MSGYTRRVFGCRSAAAVVPSSFLFGCASPARTVAMPTPGSPAGVYVTAPRHPTVNALQQCVASGLAANRAWLPQSVLLGTFNNETSDKSASSTMTQPKFDGYLKTVMVGLGFRPPDISSFGYQQERALMTTLIAPQIIVSGSLIGWDGLVSSHKQASEAGFTLGGGRLASTGTGGSEDQLSVGKVVATCHIGSDPMVIDARAFYADKDISQKMKLYRTTTATTAQAEFRLVRRNQRLSGSIVLGIGGGYSTEDTDANDLQGACLHAVQLSIILAVAEHFQVTTGVCRTA